MLNKITILPTIILLVVFSSSLYSETTIDLTKPRLKSNVSVEETLNKRRSIREYSATPLNLNDISQLLWSAQGITDGRNGKTAPSAGALYPLKVYLVAGKVKNLHAGVYQYEPSEHRLIKIKEGDLREPLSKACLGQPWVKNASINLIITAEYEITTRKYGERGIRYVHIEVGHVAQNILLQAVALELGAVPVGAFYDKEVKKLLNLKENEEPLYVIPVGKIK